VITTQDFEVDVQDVEYQRLGNKSWLARVYQPKGPGPFPSIIDIHGGAWHNGDRTNNQVTDRALAARGVLVAALDFRQPPEAGYPASVCDVNLGCRWLKVHAREFNGAPTIGAFGVSSGGHLVALSALRARDARYGALPLPGHPEADASLAYVIPAWPVIDPLYRFRFARDAGRQELVNAHLEYWGSEETMAEGSPQTALDQDEQVELPPALLLLKKGDRNHPLEMQERFVASYRKRGGQIQVETFEGLPEHGLDPTPANPESVRVIETIVGFAQRQAG
jgi:acetyl esterase